MSQYAHWKIYDGAAHLVLPTRGGIWFWCNRTPDSGVTFHQLDDAQYEERCTSCVDALMKFHNTALAPLPETMVETVTVVVQRPRDSGPAAEHIERTLARKKSWVVVSVSGSQEPVQ